MSRAALAVPLIVALSGTVAEAQVTYTPLNGPAFHEARPGIATGTGSNNPLLQGNYLGNGYANPVFQGNPTTIYSQPNPNAFNSLAGTQGTLTQGTVTRGNLRATGGNTKLARDILKAQGYSDAQSNTAIANSGPATFQVFGGGAAVSGYPNYGAFNGFNSWGTPSALYPGGGYETGGMNQGQTGGYNPLNSGPFAPAIPGNGKTTGLVGGAKGNADAASVLNGTEVTPRRPAKMSKSAKRRSKPAK